MASSLILAHGELTSRLTALLNGQFTPTTIAAGMAIALASPKKTTLMFGDLPALDSATAIVQLATQYAASCDGGIPRRDRPTILQKGILARIPPVLPPQF
ncbi:MAG: DUF1636 domain-containing protein [Cyanothece sp. SIO1E1]|nr:DUF1636 domain-containing protein [Cyanothece sp. SIO1E1]